MLPSTFVILSGIGPATERRFWQEGLLTWNDFLQRSKVPGISAQRKQWYDQELILAQAEFDSGRLDYFTARLASREHWRFFELCEARTLYLDIETTGTSPHDGDVTVVGLHRQGETVCLVRGETLTTERLQTELDACTLLVTFFGTGFDVPYLRAKFPQLTFSMPHFDLCFAARRLGLRGGLKQIERELGIERDGALHGLDGWDAVRLWMQWRAGDTAARDLLLAYNRADTANLAPLAKHVFQDISSRFGPASVGTARLFRPAPQESHA
ncbi:MAG: ribonuclease H-like domain-containing protein [Nitrospira sp.]